MNDDKWDGLDFPYLFFPKQKKIFPLQRVKLLPLNSYAIYCDHYTDLLDSTE